IFGAERTWLALAHRPRGRRGRRLDRLRLRRLPALLPQRQRRLAPGRLADEERRRPPDRALQRLGAAAEPRRRDHRRRRAGGVQARLRQPHGDLAHLRGRLRPRALRRAHRHPRRRRLLPRLPRL
ncbi:hypothetical protein PSTG_19929, partial [Puccinia striiformis f. sp. tritici PST-78]